MLSYVLNPLDYLFGSMARRGTPNQVAMGATLGMVLGVTPLLSGLWLVALLGLLIFNVNLRIAILTALLFRALGALFLDEQAYALGFLVIERVGEGGAGVGMLFRAIGETSALAWTNIHHWYAGGATILALLLFLPTYFAFSLATKWLRKSIRRLVAGLSLADLKRKRMLRLTLWIFAPSVWHSFRDAVKEVRESLEGGDDATDRSVEDIESLPLADVMARQQEQRAGQDHADASPVDVRSTASSRAVAADDEDALPELVEPSSADVLGSGETSDVADETPELVEDEELFEPVVVPMPGIAPEPTFPVADAMDDGDDSFDLDDFEFPGAVETRPAAEAVEFNDSDIELDALDDEFEDLDEPAVAAAPAPPPPPPPPSVPMHEKATVARGLRGNRGQHVGATPDAELSPIAEAANRAAKPSRAGRDNAGDEKRVATRGGTRRRAAEPARPRGKKAKRKRPAGRLRKLFVVPLLLLVVLPAGAAAGAYVFRNPIVKWAIEGPVARQMEMTIAVEGVEVDFAGGVVRLENVVMQPLREIANGQSVNGIDPAQPLFRATELYAHLDMEQLFQGRLHFAMRAMEPTLTLVRLPDGSMNYAPADARREAGTLGDGRPAQPAERVRTPEGRPATVTDADGVERHVFRTPEGERILAESVERADGATEWVWTDEAGTERRDVGEAPVVDAAEPEPYDPDRSSTLDEVRKFLEDLIERYNLDDPQALESYYNTATEYHAKYGPRVRKAFERAKREDGTLDPEEVGRIVERLLLGSATYVKLPAFEPGPNLPRLWCKEFSITNLTVNFVDLRAERLAGWAQDGYSLDIRNLATDRPLLEKPTVVLLSRGLATEEARALADAAATVEAAAAAAIVEDAAGRAAATALATRLHLHIERGLSLNDMAGWFDRDAQPFEGGEIKVYTAVPGYSREDWLRPDIWYFDSRTGEPIVERARLDRGAIGFAGADMGGVLVIQLEGTRLAAGAFGLPGRAIEFVNEILGAEAESDWRFVLQIGGKPHSPRVRLLNEAELLAKLRVLAVRAVTQVGQRVTGELLRLLRPVVDWDRFAEAHLGRPETFIIWEAGVADSARVAERIALADDVETRERAQALVDRLRNVVSPLLFADDRDLFVRALSHNSLQVAVIVVRETFEELADTVLEAVLTVLPVRERDGMTAAERREAFRRQMIAGVVDILVPELEVMISGELVLASGEPYDFSRQSRRALARFAQNSNPIVEAVVAEALEAGVGDAVRIVTHQLMPGATEAEREAKAASLRQRLLVGVAEPLVPQLAVDERDRVVLSGDPYPQRARQAVQRFRRNVGVVVGEEVTVLIREALDATAGQVERALSEALEQVPAAMFPRDFDRRGVPARLRDGLDIAVAPEIEVDENLRVHAQFDLAAAQAQARAKLGENAVGILRELTDGYLDEAVHALDAVVGEYPADYPREDVRADLHDGVAEALFPLERDAEGTPVLRVRESAGKQRLVTNLNRIAPRLAPALVDRLLQPVEDHVDRVFAAVELPDGWTASRISHELRAGVIEAYLSAEPFRYRDGAYAFQGDATAARVVAERNAHRVATAIASALVSAMVQATAEQVIGLLPALPPGYTPQRVGEELADGVGEAVVRGERLDEMRLDMDAGSAKLDANGIVMLRNMAEVTVAEPLGAVADGLAAGLDPLPDGVTRASIRARLAAGVGAAVVVGERLSEVSFDTQAGLRRMAVNGVGLGRELADPMLARRARDIVRPVGQALAAAGDRFALTPADLERAATRSTAGVGVVLFPLTAIRFTEDGDVRIDIRLESALEALRRNAEVEVGALVTLKWRRDVMGRLSEAIDPLLDERTREARGGEAHWARRAVQVVPSNFGYRVVVAETNEQRAQIATEVEPRLQEVIDDESAQAMLDQVNRMLQANNVTVEPPLSTDEMSDEEKRRYREARTPQARSAVIRDFLKGNDRVLDAVAARVPGARMLPPDQRRARARQAIDAWGG